MNEWIDVDERLPKCLEEILGYFSDRTITITCMFFEEGRFSLEDYHGKLLYWMPLPKAPM